MDNVILNKAESLERCIKRIKEEYLGHEDELESNLTKQDAIVLNIERACQISIDMALIMIKNKSLGLPQVTREVFDILEKNIVISKDMSTELKQMVGFRNLAVHDYQKIDLNIVESIIKKHLVTLLEFSKIMVKQS